MIFPNSIQIFNVFLSRFHLKGRQEKTLATSFKKTLETGWYKTFKTVLSLLISL